MIGNYLTLAYRNLLRNKFYSAITILGLAVGMTSCALIIQYVQFERSYDRFHEQGGDIYRVTMDRYVGGNFKFKSAKTYPAIAPRLKQDFPEVANYVRIMPDHGIVALENSDQRYYEANILLADASFFDVFSFKIIHGSNESLLKEPNSMVLSNHIARKYFGENNALGKTVGFYKDDGTQEVYTVTGVVEDVPANSHFKFDILISYNTLLQRYGARDNWRPSEDSWQVDDYYSYVLLNKYVNPDAIEEKLPQFFNRYKGDLFRERNVREELHLQPIQEIHLYSELQSEIGETGNYKFVYYLIVIAGFIILITWINYVNLTTARATDRTREIGVRKVFGSQRKQLISQFLLEAILTCFASFILSLALYESVLTLFRSTGMGFSIPSTLSDTVFAFAVVLAGSLVGIALSYFYPAFILSGYKPIHALKGKLPAGGQSISLRNALVLVQFFIAVIVLTGLLTIRKQITFMKTHDLGFDAEQLVVVKAASYIENGTEEEYERRALAFKGSLLQHTGISNVTESGFVPGQEIVWRQGMVRRVMSDPGTTNTYHVFAVDENFFRTYGITTVVGKLFSPSFIPADAVIINETAASQLGFAKPEDAIGEEIYVEIDGHDKARIAGVIENYNHLSLKSDYQPQIFFYRASTWSSFTVKVEGKNLTEELNTIKQEFSKAFPDNPFDYFFLDQFFDNQYKADQRFEGMFAVFSLLAIFISCLGLFGLSSYAIVQRTKEIGIRRVLGATSESVAALLSKDIIKLVFIGGFLACHSLT